MSQRVSKITEHPGYWKKHSEADFELVWAKLSHMRFEGLKESYRYAYDAGYGARKFEEGEKKEGEQ